MSKGTAPVDGFYKRNNLLPALLLAQFLALLIALTGFFSEALSHKVTQPRSFAVTCEYGKVDSCLRNALHQTAEHAA